MTVNPAKVAAGKRAMRARLAALPVGEKLRMLEVLRDRLLSIRPSAMTERIRKAPNRSPGQRRGRVRHRL